MTAGGLIFQLETARFKYNFCKEGDENTNMRVKTPTVYLISVAECIHRSHVKIVSLVNQNANKNW